MGRRGAIVLLVTAALGLLVIVGIAARDDRDLAFTIGVVPTIPAANLAPGSTVCQSGITTPGPFTRVELRTGSASGAGQPLEVDVREVYTDRRLGRGRMQSASGDPADRAAEVGKVPGGRRIAVCVRNAGEGRAQLYGNTAIASLPSRALVGDRELATDVAVVFLNDDSRSMLATLPDVFDRASVFRPGWVGAWVFWLLTGLVLIGVPLLLARALVDSTDVP